jgi:circadian clock protein KaiC
MLGGEGYYRGSSVLVSGTAGTGKTSLAAHFADAACRRGERCLYFAFEESEARSCATCAPSASTWSRGQEGPAALPRHPADALRPGDAPGAMHKLVKEFQPRAVVIDPVTNLHQGRQATR